VRNDATTCRRISCSQSLRFIAPVRTTDGSKLLKLDVRSYLENHVKLSDQRKPDTVRASPRSTRDLIDSIVSASGLEAIFVAALNEGGQRQTGG
jgi:hypothetical protein